MDISSADLSAIVFKRVVREDIGELSLDGQMLTLLMELDGRTRVGTIAKKLGQDMAAMGKILSKLLAMKLIAPVEEAISMIDRDFLDYLAKEMTLAVGPVGEVLIEDAVTDLGYGMPRFPSHRAAELVDLLSRHIRREEKRRKFKQNLVNKIREKGY